MSLTPADVARLDGAGREGERSAGESKESNSELGEHGDVQNMNWV